MHVSWLSGIFFQLRSLVRSEVRVTVMRNRGCEWAVSQPVDNVRSLYYRFANAGGDRFVGSLQVREMAAILMCQATDVPRSGRVLGAHALR